MVMIPVCFYREDYEHLSGEIMYLCTVADEYVFKKVDAHLYCAHCPIPQVLNHRHCIYLRAKIDRIGYGPFFSCARYPGLRPQPNMDQPDHKCPDPATRLMECRDYIMDEGINIRIPLDSLTKVLSRAYFDNGVLERDIARTLKLCRTLTLIMFDLDNFKKINDQYGHARGDEFLAAFAGFIKTRIARPNKIIRFGGDEFYAVLFNVSIENSVALMEEIMAAMPDMLLRQVPFETIPTISVGVVSSPEHGADDLELKERADMALYVAKMSGKNRIVVYDETTHRQHNELLQQIENSRTHDIEALQTEIARIKQYLNLT